MLKIYNTMTARKEVFEPLVTGTVRMYVCGVTVYDDCHIGHARSALVFDVIRRYLEESGMTVIFVKNFTDVDDKIIRRAQEQGTTWQDVTSRYIEAYYRDMCRLGVRQATIEPKATEHMADIIALVQTLLQKGMAYCVGEDVYFQVEQFPAYGALSKRKLEDMHAGARVEVDERKRHPMDFVLWKGAKSGEPAWKSPWGAGRPGWHIECSAMSMRHLGDTFDIHGGGADLIFPHHENEIAQSTAATGKEFARYWVHNGFVQIHHEKMSKSLGNFFTIQEIFEKSGYSEDVTGEILRYFLLSTHYRTPVEFSDHSLQEAKRALDNIYGLLQRLEEPISGMREDGQDRGLLERVRGAFRQAMDDDFNTPSAIAEFQRLRGELNPLLPDRLSPRDRAIAQQAFREVGGILGLFQLPIVKWQFKAPFARSAMGAVHSAAVGEPASASAMVADDIERQLAMRNEARRNRDFAKADEIRRGLADRGITIEDRPDGTSRWKR